MSDQDYRGMWDAARQSWPRIPLDLERFAAFARERGVAHTAAVGEDLFLACACAAGDPGAIETFDARHRGDVEVALGSMRLSADLRDEIRQRLRTKLFVRDGERAPRIATYAGKGALRGWVRAVAARCAIDVLREEKGAELPTEDALLEVFSGSADAGPEIAALKQRYRDDVNAAFAHGFATLSARQRNLLRQFFVHDIGIERIGAIYGVHRVTAFRWIAQAKIEVLRAAEKHLEPAVGGDAAERTSLMELLRSQIDLSLSRLLRSDP